MPTQQIKVTIQTGASADRPVTFVLEAPSVGAMLELGEILCARRDPHQPPTVLQVQQEDQRVARILADHLVTWEGELLDLHSGEPIAPSTDDPRAFLRGLYAEQLGDLAIRLRGGGDGDAPEKKDASESPSPSSTG